MNGEALNIRPTVPMTPSMDRDLRAIAAMLANDTGVTVTRSAVIRLACEGFITTQRNKLKRRKAAKR